MIRNVLGSLFFMCMALFAGKALAQGNAEQAAKDDKILNEYFAKNKIKATKTATGLYYVITKKGTGENVKPGTPVDVYYFGYFLDGKRFDGNMDKNYTPAGKPLNFTVGVGQVIKGWDEGLCLLNHGCRATIFIPSGLAYGPNARGPVPANAILLFDVELL